MQREKERSLLPPEHFLLPPSSFASRTAHSTADCGRVDLQATGATVQKITGAMGKNTEDIFGMGAEYPTKIYHSRSGYGKLESEGRRRTSFKGKESNHEKYGGNFEPSCVRFEAGEANPRTHKVTQSNHAPLTVENSELRSKPVRCREETFSVATTTLACHSNELRAVHHAPSELNALQATAQMRDTPERGDGGGGAGSDISLPNAASQGVEKRMLDACLPKYRGTSKTLAIEGKPFSVASNSELKHFSVSNVVHESSSGENFVESWKSVETSATTVKDGALPTATGPTRGSGAKDHYSGGKFPDEEKLLAKSRFESQMMKLDKNLQFYEDLRKKWASSPPPLTRGSPTERATLSTVRESPRSTLAPPTYSSTPPSPALDPTEATPSSHRSSASNIHEPPTQAPSCISPSLLPPSLQPRLQMQVQRVMELEKYQLNNLDSVTPDTEKELQLPVTQNHPPLPTSSSSTSSSSSREAELSEETFPFAMITNDQGPCTQERSLKLGMAEDLRGKRAKERGEVEEEEEEEENDLDNPIGTCVEQPLLRVEENKRNAFGESVANHQLDRLRIAEAEEEEEEENDVDFLSPTEKKTINLTRSFGKPLFPPPHFPTAAAPKHPPTPPHLHTVTPSHRHTLTPSLVAERSPETRNDTAIARLLQTEEEMQAGVHLLTDVQRDDTRGPSVTTRGLELASQIQEEDTRRGGGGRGERGVLSQSNQHGNHLPFSGRGYILGGKS